MQVTVEKLGSCQAKITFVVPSQDYHGAVQAQLKERAASANLKGFRPGKVPMSHVKKTFGRDLMGEIVNDALNTSSQKALDDAKVRPAAPAEMKLKTSPTKWRWKSCPTSPRPTSRS